MSSLLTFCMLPFRQYDMFVYIACILSVTAVFNIIWNLIRNRT